MEVTETEVVLSQECNAIVELLRKAKALGKTRLVVAFVDHNVQAELRSLGYEVVEGKDDESEISID